MLNTVWLAHVFEKPCRLRRTRCQRRLLLCSLTLQAHELHTRHSAEAMKAEKWQFEYKNLLDKYDALLKEKEVSRTHKVQLC